MIVLEPRVRRAIDWTGGPALARARIGLTYWWRHRRLPNLKRPLRFTELVQRRKLEDHDPALPMLADKLTAKDFAASRIGVDWIIPTLWHGTELPASPPWPRPFVVKSRHGSNQTAFVRTGREDWSAIRRAAKRWLERSYGRWLDEWLYDHIPRGLIVEPFVGEAGALPVDYKFYVFAGKVAFAQVHLNREHDHRWVLLDRDWRRVSRATRDADPAPPTALARMIAAAETLSEGIDFVRVDFYEIAGKPLFGEMTFYPGSGLDRFHPDTLDTLLGAHWLAASKRSA